MVFAFRRYFLAFKISLICSALILIALEFFLYFYKRPLFCRIEPTRRVRKRKNKKNISKPVLGQRYKTSLQFYLSPCWIAYSKQLVNESTLQSYGEKSFIV